MLREQKALEVNRLKNYAPVSLASSPSSPRTWLVPRDEFRYLNPPNVLHLPSPDILSDFADLNEEEKKAYRDALEQLHLALERPLVFIENVKSIIDTYWKTYSNLPLYLADLYVILTSNYDVPEFPYHDLGSERYSFYCKEMCAIYKIALDVFQGLNTVKSQIAAMMASDRLEDKSIADALVKSVNLKAKYEAILKEKLGEEYKRIFEVQLIEEF